jgi:hypothetical protein
LVLSIDPPPPELVKCETAISQLTIPAGAADNATEHRLVQSASFRNAAA